MSDPNPNGPCFMFTNIGDQLSDSFEELMLEIRAMRRELERIRKVLDTKGASVEKPVRQHVTRRARTTAA